MDAILYAKRLKAIIPEDENINTHNVLSVFSKIDKSMSLKQLLQSEMMIATIASLVKMLYCEKLINLKLGSVTWIQKEPSHCNVKILNVINPEMQYRNEEITKNIFENRKTSPNLKYYQSFNTYNSLVRRFNIMQQFGDTSEKSIVFLGDDELFSVFYALNATSYERILVLDIDKRILNEINGVSDLYDLKIETMEYDVFNPRVIDDNYDVFFASGLKKLPGLLAFIFTCAKLLKNNDSACGYFTYYPYVDKIDEIKKQQDIFNYTLQKKLNHYGFFFEHLSVCDEIQMSKSLIKKIEHWILKDNNLLLKKDPDFLSILLKNEELSADPLFPYFSVKPINIARIKSVDLNYKEVDDYLKMIRRFRK